MSTAQGSAAGPTERVVGAIHEVQGDIESPYVNHDLAPATLKQRKWGTRDIAALWISMAACVPTYTLASGLIKEGMSWWQAVLTIFLGNCIVLVPMVLNAHAGTKYGIPFPVYCRASFGIRGANIPAVLRALVACGWFGIQTWVGGKAIYTIVAIWVPSLETLPKIPLVGINPGQLGGFLLFWAINVWVIHKGIESIRILLNIKAPLLIALGIGLLVWAYVAAGGFGPMLDQPGEFAAGGAKEGQFFGFFFPALTATVGFWATLSLNIPDFTRYARSQRAQVAGQILGLPATMGLYSFIGVAVTSATVTIYGSAIWEPADLIAKFKNPLVLAFALLALSVATLATNLAANVVSPANDFANLAPKALDFRRGGFITAGIGVLMQPWRLMEDAHAYIIDWLGSYSVLLGAIGGVLICDYWLVRRCKLDLVKLYQADGPYWYSGGFNPIAVIALVCGIAPNMPGFLRTVGAIELDGFFADLYSYAWFVGFGVSFVVYAALTFLRARRAPAPSRTGAVATP